MSESAEEAGYDRIPSKPIEAIGLSIYHPVGSGKMGATTDEKAVVNPNLKVIGVSGLKVMDASVMLNVTMMIAQKKVDMLKNDYAKKIFLGSDNNIVSCYSKFNIN
ncbi:glucose dehydrogenase-like [FAD: quinone] [Leptotrombidium deliense]|uniref:Glucose dehydrogenase-like [FAD: quinone] n=1 Tax=Leptotrombidium deliense TaxID=299467 RepID=A0A443RT78_9ACAR|nr:glucose dehydrogenase-like [FAD: quinone] [Leptotrombidium deliense]